MDNLEIRRALPEEAPLIAKSIVSAMHLKSSSLSDVLSSVCAREDTLYSWKNTLTATLDEKFAGSITSYDGAFYKEGRERTFAFFGRSSAAAEMDDETRAGEYYLDSLAVLPEFRGKGIGHVLMSQALETGEALGFYTASLIVESGYEHLLDLYSRWGFSVDTDAHSLVRPELPAGHLWCFGTDFLRMIIPLH